MQKAFVSEEYSPIRHLASIVCPPWMDRERVIFIMLTFAFDAGGDEKTPMLTVAGFASSVGHWDAFSLAWQERLKRDGIEYFHAADLNGFWGPFKHWQDRSDRKDLSRRLCADLMGILKSHVYRRFAHTVENKNFQKMNEQLREEFALSAYSLAGRTCEKYARKWVVEEFTPGKMVPVEVVFEEGDQGKGKLQQQLASDYTIFPIFKPKRDRVMEDGTIRAGFVPLQAADWFAYEVNRATQKFSDGTLKSESQLRWPMQEFLRNPSGYMGFYTPEDLKEMESGIELQKKIIEWEVATGLSGLSKKAKAHGTLKP